MIGRRHGALAVLGIALGSPVLTQAQSGPFTASLPLQEPATFAFRIGPLTVSPNLQLPNIGYDDNVFNDNERPKRDWTLTMTPDLQLFARSGLIQFVGVTSSDFTYYSKYRSERSVARRFRGRVDVSLSRFKPWVAAANLDLHDRPNREIDTRARFTNREVSAGVAFELSSIADFYAMAVRTQSVFANGEAFKGVNLAEALSRRGEQYSGGMKIRATPFTTVLLSGQVDHDRFVNARDRNTRSRTVAGAVEFAPEAVVRGRAQVGIQDFRPNDPAVPAYRGVVSSGSLTYAILGRAELTTLIERAVQYSFEKNHNYYVETGADVTYTHRLAGPYDARVGGTRRWLDYTRTTPGLRPRVDAALVGVGYNLRDNSRIGFNFEYSERLDVLRSDRKFNRRRVFGSYTYRRNP